MHTYKHIYISHMHPYKHTYIHTYAQPYTRIHTHIQAPIHKWHGKNGREHLDSTFPSCKTVKTEQSEGMRRWKTRNRCGRGLEKDRERRREREKGAYREYRWYLPIEHLVFSYFAKLHLIKCLVTMVVMVFAVQARRLTVYAFSSD